MDAQQKAYALVMGQVVSTLRGRHGMTQADLARAVGVAQATISRVERGTLIPDALLAGRIAATFGITTADLLRFVDDGFERTREAAEGALGNDRADQQPWWAGALAVAGIAGLAGLAIFAVAAALSEEE